ncbi:MAG TPA: hypothetical protein VFD32_15680 [Dehalococcoidia bacterium]|nr:hypothetical protein [Dehalococcoidia bacterium]
MAAHVLFFGCELLLWLALGCTGWLVVTLVLRPRASLLALLCAVVAAAIGGALPGLLGWRSAPGLLCGFALALAAATLASWQTLCHLAVRPKALGG